MVRVSKTEWMLAVTLATLAVLEVQSKEVKLPAKLIKEIHSYKDDVKKIIDYVLTGPGKHEAMRHLERFTDTAGPRSTGSKALENAIEYAVEELEKDFTNVVKELVKAEKWKRNTEYIKMLIPRQYSMAMMSLGSSVGTGSGAISGEVVVVRTFEEMEEKANGNLSAFADKIIVYNMAWKGYSNSSIYRFSGASRAAKYGAKAALIKSITDFSIYSPHTGEQRYNLTVSQNKIPIAAITVEDAELMQRYYDNGQTVQVELFMNCTNEGLIDTYNVVTQVDGNEKPQELVIIGGHIDSWDVGSGVMDDGGGVIISWQALLNMKALGLTTKRSVRTVFWTAEEIGLVGATHYYDAHKYEADSISLIMESDYGTFKPIGIGFSGTESARTIIREILSMLVEINVTQTHENGAAPDISMWIAKSQVPGAELWTANDDYFFFHHTHGDSISMENPDHLDLCSIVWTTVTYVVANLNEKLPREEIYVSRAGRIHGGQSLFAILSLILIRFLSSEGMSF